MSFFKYSQSFFFLCYLNTTVHVQSEGGGGGGGKRRGLGPRNDVLTTCKAVTLSDGQRIIAVFSHSEYFKTFRSKK